MCGGVRIGSDGKKPDSPALISTLRPTPPAVGVSTPRGKSVTVRLVSKLEAKNRCGDVTHGPLGFCWRLYLPPGDTGAYASSGKRAVSFCLGPCSLTLGPLTDFLGGEMTLMRHGFPLIRITRAGRFYERNKRILSLYGMSGAIPQYYLTRCNFVLSTHPFRVSAYPCEDSAADHTWLSVSPHMSG